MTKKTKVNKVDLIKEARDKVKCMRFGKPILDPKIKKKCEQCRFAFECFMVYKKKYATKEEL